MLAGEQVDTLASFTLFAPVPRVELAWLVARGDVQRVACGATLRESGAPIDEMWIVLTGRMAVHAPNGGSWRKVYDLGPGFVLGVMPFSRMHAAPARLVAEDDTIMFAMSRSHFSDLVRECPELTAALVHQMVDRARDYRTAQL